MTSKNWIIPCLVLAALALLVVATAQARAPAQRPNSAIGALRQVQDIAPGTAASAESALSAAEGLGTGFTYQGQLNLDGQPVDNTCDFQFSLYEDELGQTQIGATQTITNVEVLGGLFTIRLDFGATAFQGDACWLGIQLQCQGDGDYADLGLQELTAAPYALYAAKSGGYENMLTVAKSGGDYTSIQAAIDSIGDAATDNPYLVWIAPGVYSETVTLKPYVHLQGAGQGATIITSTASNEAGPLTESTLELAANTGLRDLTVGNSGTSLNSIALLATDGTSQTLVTDVTVWVQGNSTSGNSAIYLTGNDTGIVLLNVTALAENGGGSNYGLYIDGGAAVTLRGGSFTARGGSNAGGICNDNSSTLEAENVAALGEDGSTNYGLHNDNAATATLHGGSFIAHGGNNTRGIYTHGSGTELKAERITVLGEAGTTSNRGLESSVGAAASVTQSVLEGADNSIVTTGGGGPVAVSNSRLVGGTASGNVSCVAVSRDSTFNASGCP